MFFLSNNTTSWLLQPHKLIKKLWSHNYQDFKLIFEQKDQLHYFQVTAKTQSKLVKTFISFSMLLILIFIVLATHSGVSEWRYKNLETKKLLADQKRQEALSALAELSADNEFDNESNITQDDLIKNARKYRERLDKMQMLIAFSSQELKLANYALEQGLAVAGVKQGVLQKIKSQINNFKTGIGGNSEEITLGSMYNAELEQYRKNLRQLETLKEVYKSLPSDPPVTKAITTSKYGVRIHPITNKLTAHEGIDYVSTFDSNAKSVMPGVVETVKKSDTGYGNMVVILHPNNVRTIYAHLDRINVKPGQKVEKGATLGQIGNTGFSTGKHLHYEISIDHVKVNPSIITAMTKNVQ
jgi:murein DD-endopeptidase MepM/ murein hydrolase activator NlpD